MTYCVGVKLDAGLVFLSDSRTNAGLDQISTFRKMMVYERPSDRFMVMLSAGNLSISQSVREILQVEKLDNGDAAADHDLERDQHVRRRARARRARCAASTTRTARRSKKSGLDFNASMIFGGQIRGEAMRLFLVYSAGNFIEATRETCFFQIGESKYGKPVLDRMITPVDAARRGGQVRAGVDGLDAEVEPLGRPAARPARLRGEPAASVADRLHRRAQPVLPDDPQQLGPEAAPGVRVDRRSAVGRRPVGSGTAVRAVAALRADAARSPPGREAGHDAQGFE